VADVKPLEHEEFAALFEEALRGLDPEQREHYECHRIDPEPVDCARYNDDVVEPLWAVAASGDQRLAYDDEEDEFGIGMLDATGVLRRWGTWGPLGAALENFPESD
jgi:hypothetical protein